MCVSAASGLAAAHSQRGSHPRDSLAVTLRVQRASLDPTMHLEAWDPSAKVTCDRALLNELTSLRFFDSHAHVAIVGPVGVGKTFLAHALGHIACRRGASVLAVRTEQMLKTLKQARLDHSYEIELREIHRRGPVAARRLCH
jgi:DNA replication protein DnaC